MSNQKRIEIRFPLELYAQIEAAAGKVGIPVATWVRLQAAEAAGAAVAERGKPGPKPKPLWENDAQPFYCIRNICYKLPDNLILRHFTREQLADAKRRWQAMSDAERAALKDRWDAEHREKQRLEMESEPTTAPVAETQARVPATVVGEPMANPSAMGGAPGALDDVLDGWK
jgi:hypothetical protein